MGSRWFGTLHGPKHVRQRQEGSVFNEAKAVMPPAATNSWRSWLSSGTRRAPIDRRRARGAEAQLKKILIEGINNGGERPEPWQNFSSAMARQAINEAINELPSQHKEVVKLAYFGGLTNRQIALQLGLTISGVRRRLRESLAIVSTYVGRGRDIGRRAVHGLVLWLYFRFGDGTQRTRGPAIDQVLQAGTAAVVTVAVAALLVTQDAMPGHATQPWNAPAVTATGPAGSTVLSVQHKVLTTVTGPVSPVGSVGGVAVPGAAAVPAIALPSLPVEVQVPAKLPVNLPAHLPVRLHIRLPVELQTLPPAIKGLSTGL